MTRITTELRRRLGLAAGALVALALPVAAEPVCERMAHDGQGYVVCRVDAAQEGALRLWDEGADGAPVRNFDRVRAQLGPGEVLAFAMNAGMYHPDLRAVGLLVIEGDERKGIVTRGARGENFGMLPNGVFCTGAKKPFAVIESRTFAKRPPACRLATQSGPMLVIDGDLHPKFLPDSSFRNIRNGVGVSRDGQTAWFAISDGRVTFHEFARLFRDGLDTPNALFLDGSISRLYAPELGRADWGRSLGPIVGLVGR